MISNLVSSAWKLFWQNQFHVNFAYHRSEVIWEMASSRNKKRWKPVELIVGSALEKMFQEKKRGIHDIQDTDWIVDFSDPDQV